MNPGRRHRFLENSLEDCRDTGGLEGRKGGPDKGSLQSSSVFRNELSICYVAVEG